MPATLPPPLKVAEIRSRIEPDLKEDATRILASCGLNVSDAIRLFLRRVVVQNGLPFEVKAPNAATLAAWKKPTLAICRALVRFRNYSVNSKKTAKRKRANPPREFTRTKVFFDRSHAPALGVIHKSRQAENAVIPAGMQESSAMVSG